MESVKKDLPKGKLTIRHIQSRNVLQAYAGRGIYLTCVSGDTIERVIHELKERYNVPVGTTITSYAYNEKEVFAI